MSLDERIEAFAALGAAIKQYSGNQLEQLIVSASNENPWFTASNIQSALMGIGKFLERSALSQWTSKYELAGNNEPQWVATIMAGNSPMVGFHDLMSVLVSGHKAIVKQSSKDNVLMKELINLLVKSDERMKANIQIVEGQLKGFDAVIATGSDNSSRYFEYYFGKYPNIIRQNRTSCSILTGNESRHQLEALGSDIFMYFGLGCRNVSKLFLPLEYDPTQLFEHWKDFDRVIHHHKYANNYDYQKSILLVNQKPFLDSGFSLMVETQQIVSPISVIHYEFYANDEELTHMIHQNSGKIQCIVGEHSLCTVDFGQSQVPELWDYADGVDTLSFLASLN